MRGSRAVDDAGWRAASVTEPKDGRREKRTGQEKQRMLEKKRKVLPVVEPRDVEFAEVDEAVAELLDRQVEVAELQPLGPHDPVRNAARVIVIVEGQGE